jgi:hypothetical protein
LRTGRMGVTTAAWSAGWQAAEVTPTRRGSRDGPRLAVGESEAHAWAGLAKKENEPGPKKQ